jgi:hypothetical protein
MASDAVDDIVVACEHQQKLFEICDDCFDRCLAAVRAEAYEECAKIASNFCAGLDRKWVCEHDAIAVAIRAVIGTGDAR